MVDKDQALRDTAGMWDELSAYLFDLANIIHEHREMLFRLSDKAKSEADKLRRQFGLPRSGD